MTVGSTKYPLESSAANGVSAKLLGEKIGRTVAANENLRASLLCLGDISHNLVK